MVKKQQSPVINQTAIGDGNIQVAGDNNTVNVNQTFVQKIINVFKADNEPLEQRNRRIMLGHVENFWVKGILEKSLHGAVLLELGIKEDPDAVKTYPWAIKREATKETLPVGMSMLEIFEQIGMGRSLIILGAPGSGKTTMLLELTRQLIERAREDVTEPIPVVFNLSSWIEKLPLAEWLARELNTLYYVPKKIAPTWVKENKMLLLLDGLDEVPQESRDKCVDAINQFRKENGLTSMAVCSRMQDYSELKTQLAFEGAIEIQSLTLDKVDEYFDRFGNELAGVKQLLENDVVLREMAETPLFLSIMTLAYQGALVGTFESKNLGSIETRRKHLFDTYIQQAFNRATRTKNVLYRPDQTKHWLSWLARELILHGQSLFLLEQIKRNWLESNPQKHLHKVLVGVVVWVSSTLVLFLAAWLVSTLFHDEEQRFLVILGIVFGTVVGVVSALVSGYFEKPSEVLLWTWKKAWFLLAGPCIGFIAGVFLGYGFTKLDFYIDKNTNE
jgi:hypothetical protein